MYRLPRLVTHGAFLVSPRPFRALSTTASANDGHGSPSSTAPSATRGKELKSVADFFDVIQDYSRGLTLLGGFTIVIIGVATMFSNANNEIATNKKLVDKETKRIEEKAALETKLAAERTELNALKNLLLFGQSEEYRQMRKEYAGGSEAELKKKD
jgi:hypothetical protein